MRSRARINLQRTVLRHSQDEPIVIEGSDGPGQRIGGRWSDPVSVTASISASVQPASPESLQLLDDGSRTGSEIELWCTTEGVPNVIKRAEGKPAAVVQYKGRRFKVVAVEDWWEHGRYWFALCSMVDQ